MIAIFKGKKKEMTTMKQRVIQAAKDADRVEYITIEGMPVTQLWLGDTKLISVASKFWDFA